jgi:alpha-L-rhamnosidase
MSTGLIGTRYLLQALSDAGGVDTALDLLTQRSDPSWGYMLDQSVHKQSSSFLWLMGLF